jgi:hypothetical protein
MRDPLILVAGTKYTVKYRDLGVARVCFRTLGKPALKSQHVVNLRIYPFGAVIITTSSYLGGREAERPPRRSEGGEGALGEGMLEVFYYYSSRCLKDSDPGAEFYSSLCWELFTEQVEIAFLSLLFPRESVGFTPEVQGAVQIKLWAFR